MSTGYTCRVRTQHVTPRKVRLRKRREKKPFIIKLFQKYGGTTSAQLEMLGNNWNILTLKSWASFRTLIGSITPALIRAKNFDVIILVFYLNVLFDESLRDFFLEVIIFGEWWYPHLIKTIDPSVLTDRHPVTLNRDNVIILFTGYWNFMNLVKIQLLWHIYLNLPRDLLFGNIPFQFNFCLLELFLLHFEQIHPPPPLDSFLLLK